VLIVLVENFPGFPDGILGMEMMDKFRAQSIRFGTTIITETISKLDLSSRPFKYWREGTEDDADAFESADAIILATGASAKRLNLPGEDTYWNSGISACAVCDGAVPIFRWLVNSNLYAFADLRISFQRQTTSSRRGR
jgi:thioredoxin reductase (NADPH)